MNILFLSRWFPFPADNGSKIRVFNLLRQLSRRHTVDLVSFTAGEPIHQAMAELQRYCRTVKTTPFRPFKPNRLTALMGYFSTLPRSVIDMYDQKMQRLIIQTAREGNHQLVIASELDMAIYAQPLRGMVKIIEEAELASLYEQSLNAAAPAQRLRTALMWQKWVRYIKRIRRQFDGFTVVSRAELDLIEKFDPQDNSEYRLPPIQIIPNGVSLEDYRGDFGIPLPNTLIYSGALTYHANFDAVSYFIDEILPEIRRSQPAVTLTVTGSLQGVALEKIHGHQGVVFSGYLDDIRPAIAQSWASIVPLRIGGGTRLKILESLAIGTPVISTRKGAEGLDLKDGSDILLANSAPDFASQTLRLLNDPALRNSLSRNGKIAITNQYDWDTIGSQFCNYIEQIAANNKNHEPYPLVS
ncbi:MAG: glycosyltransferase [Chloroflexi bacterium]|nr:glycosyltransferase [Chloroflexota bacterium]